MDSVPLMWAWSQCFLFKLESRDYSSARTHTLLYGVWWCDVNLVDNGALFDGEYEWSIFYFFNCEKFTLGTDDGPCNNKHDEWSIFYFFHCEKFALANRLWVMQQQARCCQICRSMIMVHSKLILGIAEIGSIFKGNSREPCPGSRSRSQPRARCSGIAM